MKRNLNIEILRILCMMLIVLGHCVLYGGFSTGNDFMYQFYRIISIPAVNIYVLISSYFIFDINTYKLKNIFKLYLQVFFFSVLLFLIFSYFNNNISLKGLLYSMLPVSTNQYWFARVYICFYAFAPFISILLKKLSKSQYEVLMIITIVLFSLWRNFIPFATTVNPEGGNSIIWFFVLAVISGYIKLHYKPKKSYIYILNYFSSLVLTITLYYFLHFISVKLGFSGKGTSLFTEYTSITILWMSVSLFLFFISLKDNKILNIKIYKLITFFSTSTFSVYLIHEHSNVRNIIYKTLFSCKPESMHIYIYIPIAVILIFVTCVFIDKITWKIAERILNKINFKKIQNKINKYMISE